MSCEVCRHHNEEESARYGEYWKKVWFEAKEGADGKEGDGL